MFAVMSDDPIKKAQDAAEQLQGTCKALHELGPEFEALENDPDFCAELDQLVFCCDRCMWWFEASEMADDEWICQECADEQ